MCVCVCVCVYLTDASACLSTWTCICLSVCYSLSTHLSCLDTSIAWYCSNLLRQARTEICCKIKSSSTCTVIQISPQYPDSTYINTRRKREIKYNNIRDKRSRYCNRLRHIRNYVNIGSKRVLFWFDGSHCNYFVGILSPCFPFASWLVECYPDLRSYKVSCISRHVIRDQYKKAVIISPPPPSLFLWWSLRCHRFTVDQLPTSIQQTTLPWGSPT